jgi:DNA-binding transcriptional ArsR family regulator
MSGLIDRLQDRTAAADERPRVLDVTDAESDEVIDALASDTRRTVFRTLFEEPGTPSEVATRMDTSVQNVHYHLSTLREARLVEGVDTRYSEKGNEMTVYAPASDPIVFVGDAELRPRVERSITEVVGGLGLLVVAALLVQWGAKRLAAGVGRTGPAVGPAARVPLDGDAEGLVSLLLEPGVSMFLGCLLVVAVLVVAGFGAGR